MPTFHLTKDTLARLRAKFEEFQRERERLRGLLADYVADYRQFQGTPADRKEYLEERYRPRAVKMSHLLPDGEGKILWHVQDIALLLGRDASTVTRTLSHMAESDGWCSRLLALQEPAKSANGNAIHVYRQEIFDLILDRWEEEYLLRFAEPRRGSPDKAPDIGTVRRFWQYLKDSAQVQQEHFVRQEEQTELPGLPPMRWRDILSLIWNKVFTFKTGTIASVAVAVCYQAARHWPDTSPWFIAASGLVLVLCVALLHLRRAAAGLLSSVGAVAMLFSMLWGANLYSSGEAIHSVNGTALPSQANEPASEHILTLAPELDEGPKVIFRVISDFYDNLKEVFYRVSPETEYRSTGFNDIHYPNLLIESEQKQGPITLDVKYTDTEGKEHGPWSYSFDITKERFNLSKDFFLHQMNSWINLSYDKINGINTVFFELNFDSKYADNVVNSVLMAVNNDTPELLIPVEKGHPFREYLPTEGLQYIITGLIFDDGTSSDIRRTTLNSSIFAPR